jgi:cell division protein FtsL
MGERFSKMKKLLILVTIALVLAALGAVLSVHPIVVA